MPDRKEIKKPPIGVSPLYIFEEPRIKELCRALYEYSIFQPGEQQQRFINELYQGSMLEWAVELVERIKKVREDNKS